MKTMNYEETHLEDILDCIECPNCGGDAYLNGDCYECDECGWVKQVY